MLHGVYVRVCTLHGVDVRVSVCICGVVCLQSSWARYIDFLTDIPVHHNENRRSSNHLLRILNDVLLMAKTESGRIELELQGVELAPVLREVCMLRKLCGS